MGGGDVRFGITLRENRVSRVHLLSRLRGLGMENLSCCLARTIPREGETSVCTMGVVCDDFLHLWHVIFGIPGAKNDSTYYTRALFSIEPELENGRLTGGHFPVQNAVCVPFDAD